MTDPSEATCFCGTTTTETPHLIVGCCVEHIFASGQAVMQMAFEDDEEFMPNLHVLYLEDGQPKYMICGLAMNGHPTDTLRAMVGTNLLPPAIQAVVFMVDSYCLLLDEKNTSDAERAFIRDEGIPRGTLAERFQIGDPRVSESLAITMVSKGDSFFQFLPYTRNPDHTLTWKEAPPLGDGEVTGAVRDALDGMVQGEARA